MAVSRTSFKFVEVKELDKLARDLKRVSLVVGAAWKKSTAEFGAYMLYSLFLEEGTKKMAARPHIKQAIKKNSKFIINSMRDGTLDIAKKMLSGRRVDVDAAIQKLWTRTLNDQPRIFAVNETKLQKIFEFGFHRRSIRGYGIVRSAVDIATDQFIAGSKREEAAVAKQARRKKRRKKKKKKRGG